MMTRMPNLSRRAVLRLGAGAATGTVGVYALDRLLSSRPPLAAPVTMTGSGVPLAPSAPLAPAPAINETPTMAMGSFISAARGGVATNWAIARPPGQTKPLRPVIALHGKGSNAATVMAGGVEQGLAQAVGAGLPPFAMVAVDGGGSYWHKRSGYLPGGVSWLVDGRVRRVTARRQARSGPHRCDLRGEPGPVAVPRGGRSGRIRRPRRLGGQLGIRDARTSIYPDQGGLR
jgi:hypothetical protein